MSGDADLILRAAAGDREAFDALIGPRWERLHRIAGRITGDWDEARDVAQQVALRLWQTLSRFRAGEDVDGWIYRMTVNLAIDALRKRQARREDLLAEVPDALAPPGGSRRGPLERVLVRELEVALEDCTRELPPRQKAVFVLARVEGLEPSEIARMMDLAPSTVRNHLFQARAAVATRMRARYPELCAAWGVSSGGDDSGPAPEDPS
ncbi:MAG: RNA polymerase sigma factor [Acidobacteria bacterium]|jgi:RNA polymerase sigma-70 factor (ECF subfamily)|nr:RNA polymerase sigma factor [Acidobacteriota bacterium]